MDHDHDHDHGSGSPGDGGRTCPMIMTFHGGHCEKILWKEWLAYTVTEFVFSALAIFAVAFAYEGLKFLREYHLRKVLRKETERLAAMQLKANNFNEGSCSNTPLHVAPQSSWWQRMLSGPHVIQTMLNLIQIVISYLLMLIFMTFNYWLCLAVVLGLAVGYFCFGWIKQEVYENECCH